MADQPRSDASSETVAAPRPRAEFRVFGDGLADLVSRRASDVATTPPDQRAMAPELYLVSLRTDDAVVKVRAGLLDVKVKTGETPEGYEIFEPREKLVFPVSLESLARVLSALELEADLKGDTFTIDDVVALARHHPDLVATAVEKTRYGFTVGAVICEYATVRFDGVQTESAACESDDYGAIAPVVDALGLTGRENVNYPKAAKRIAGLVPDRSAKVDSSQP